MYWFSTPLGGVSIVFVNIMRLLNIHPDATSLLIYSKTNYFTRNSPAKINLIHKIAEQIGVEVVCNQHQFSERLNILENGENSHYSRFRTIIDEFK